MYQALPGDDRGLGTSEHVCVWVCVGVCVSVCVCVWGVGVCVCGGVGGGWGVWVV